MGGEEESRAWQRGANSDASLRPFGWSCCSQQSPLIIIMIIIRIIKIKILKAHLGNARLHRLGAEEGGVAVGPACLTMKGDFSVFWSQIDCVSCHSSPRNALIHLSHPCYFIPH